MSPLLTILAAAAALLTQYVDPMIGTSAHGHTFPGAAYPFGMVQLSPDTRPKAGDWDGCSGYHYSDSLIYGFSHTHLSGTGCDDWCDILLTPGDGPSTFSHKQEKAAAGYYEVRLDNGIQARLTVGRRVGMHEYTFPGGSVPRITLDLTHRDYLSAYSIQADGKVCRGHRRSDSWARGQDVYFYLEFSAPAGCELLDEGKKAVFTFPKGSRSVSVRVALSSVSEEGARNNLLQEYPKSFKALRNSTQKAWEAYLGKLDCPAAEQKTRRIFYTALYHTAIHPSLYSDADGRYRGMDREVHQADGWERYTVFSLWDTYRGLHPLLSRIEPGRTVDFIRSMLSVYEEGGKLPVWELSGYETNCMIGYHSAPVIADALARGITGFDVEKAYEALKVSSHRPEFGLDSFRANGLVLADDEHESVSKTLEYAYDDWCVAQVALYLGHTEEAREYLTSAQYWRNVYDPETGFMRARLNGRWFSPFDPREVNNNYTEANSWQYSFAVPHDVAGLIDAMGGPEAFGARLDTLFTAPEATTGRTQADITGLIGQYAHGNEPSHHIAYLYDVIGRSATREARVKQILETLYTDKPDGLCGNEDCGQLSAWYVLSSLGQYPLCPAHLSAGITAVPKTIVTNPVFEMESDLFADSLQVAVKGEGTLWFRVGETPFQQYVRPFTIYEPCTMEAYAEKDGVRSFVTRSTVHQIQQDRSIRLLHPYSRQYTAGGDEGLIDGARGGINWRTGGWQGYQDTDFEAIVDLHGERSLSVLGAGFCQDARSWIWMPTEVVFSVSDDGENFREVAYVPCSVKQDDMNIQVWDCEVPVAVKAAYVKVFARNIGTIPEWHPGAGYPGFIFVDEIWAK